MRLIVPALRLVFQVLTFVSAGKIHCLNVSVSKMPENTHELIKKIIISKSDIYLSRDTQS
jgi:hypothetical protein